MVEYTQVIAIRIPRKRRMSGTLKIPGFFDMNKYGWSKRVWLCHERPQICPFIPERRRAEGRILMLFSTLDNLKRKMVMAIVFFLFMGLTMVIIPVSYIPVLGKALGFAFCACQF